MQADPGGNCPRHQQPGHGAAGARAAPRWRRVRPWLPMLVKPLRRTVLLFVLLLIIEYLVVPGLVGASKDLYLLGQVNPILLAVGG